MRSRPLGAFPRTSTRFSSLAIWSKTIRPGPAQKGLWCSHHRIRGSSTQQWRSCCLSWLRRRFDDVYAAEQSNHLSPNLCGDLRAARRRLDRPVNAEPSPAELHHRPRVRPSRTSGNGPARPGGTSIRPSGTSHLSPMSEGFDADAQVPSRQPRHRSRTDQANARSWSTSLVSTGKLDRPDPRDLADRPSWHQAELRTPDRPQHRTASTAGGHGPHRNRSGRRDRSPPSTSRNSDGIERAGGNGLILCDDPAGNLWELRVGYVRRGTPEQRTHASIR